MQGMLSRRWAWGLGVAVALAPAGCVATDVREGSVIDGFGIGERYDCPTEENPDAECSTYVDVATTGLDERDPAHLPTVRVTLHHQLFQWDDGTLSTATCSGGCMDVAVFYLVDGSYRAIAVGTPGVSTEAMTIPYGSIGRPDPP